MRILRGRLARALTAVATAAMLAGGVTVASAPAASAATCYGYSCHGHDPTVYGCSATSTKQSQVYDVDGAEVAVVQNRYAYGCNANWVRGWLTSTGIARGYMIWVYISTTDSHGNYEFMCYPGPNNTGNLTEYCQNPPYGGSSTVWSDMVDGTNVTYAYVEVVTDSGTVVGTSPAASQ